MSENEEDIQEQKKFSVVLKKILKWTFRAIVIWLHSIVIFFFGLFFLLSMVAGVSAVKFQFELNTLRWIGNILSYIASCW